jgi:hypothetical protein
VSYVYKYQPINDNTKDSLRNRYLYFAKPSQLNDPFDSRVRVYWEGTFEEKRNWLASRGLAAAPNANMLLEHPGRMPMTAFPAALIEKSNDVMSILSLGRTAASVQMWSHYAKNHSGLCLQIEVSNSDGDDGLQFLERDFTKRSSPRHPKGFLKFAPVAYKDDLPDPINFLTADALAFGTFVFTKHTDWAYERELRIMIYDTLTNGSQRIGYGDNFIKGIVFGAKASPETIIEIMEISHSSLEPSVKFYKASKSEEKYEMTFKELSGI